MSIQPSLIQQATDTTVLKPTNDQQWQAVRDTAAPGLGKYYSYNKNGVKELIGGYGGGLTGDPNAIVYFDATGANAIDDAKLTAAPIDQFGRPQIKDIRKVAGVGPVWKQGEWTLDGDPSNEPSEGCVIYGANANGVQNGNNGGYSRVKSDRFGIAQIINGVNGNNLFYAFRVDYISLYLKDDLNIKQFEVVRDRGTMRTGSGITANRPAAANVGEQWFDISLGANGGKPIWFVGGGNWIDASGALV